MEEERYANKVIEYFNNGILRLDDRDRGITLRAYLAQKLGCDPMRITKKYTGASCLGKRVYHAQKSSSKIEEMDRATENLDNLEGEFRTRLLQMTKRKRNNGGKNYAKFASLHSPPATSSAYTTQWQSQSKAMYPYSEHSFATSQSDPGLYTAGQESYQLFGHQDETEAVTPTEQESTIPSHIKVSEHDSEAASSLLGFFHHIERQSSQQNMHNVVEEAQKNTTINQLPPLNSAPTSPF